MAATKRQEFANLDARIANHPRTDLAFSVVSFHEQVLGCHAYLNRAPKSTDLVHGYKVLAKVQNQYKAATILDFTTAAAAVLDGLIAQRVRIAAMVLRFAAIALANGLTLLTRNKEDFGKVPGLTIDDWTL